MVHKCRLNASICLKETDFLAKRGSKSPQNGPVLIPMTLAQWYTETDERRPRRCHRARAYHWTCDQGKVCQRAPSSTSPSSCQLSLFSESKRGKSVDTLMQTESSFNTRSTFLWNPQYYASTPSGNGSEGS